MRPTLPALFLLSALAPLARANQVTLTPSTVHSITPNVGFEYVANCGLQIGFNTAFDIVHDGLVRFDVASAILPGSRVNSARLELTGQVHFPGTVDLHRILTPWGPCQTTIWFVPWTQPGGDYAPVTASTSMVWGTTVFPSTAALVADVQMWVDQPGTSLGWQIRDPSYWAEGYYASSTVQLVIDFDPPCPAPTTYCVGAPNSVGAGASISSAGSPRISDHDFGVVVSGCSPNAPGFFFFGTAQQQLPWGDGFLCVDGQLFRLLPAVFADSQGTAGRPIDFTVGSATVITAGSTWNFQYKYRDIVAGGTGFNSSNGLAATFCP